MSAALLRKSLELVDSYCFTTGKITGPTGKKSIGKKKKGINKQAVILHTGLRGKRGKSKGEGRSVEAVRKHLQSNSSDRTAENLRCLQILSSCSQVDTAIANKVLERSGKGTKVVKKEKPKKEEKTAFTEEDFAKFEREYFVSK